VAVNPDVELQRVARAERWEVLRFDRLGRRLKAAGAIGTAALVGTAGRAAAGRRTVRAR
jgi:hypothetical protein